MTMDDVAGSRPFRPDVSETVTDDDLVTAPPASGGRRRRELPKDVTAVRLQILAVQVMRGLNGWLGASSNGVIVVSSVVDGLGTEPITFQGKPYLGIKDGDLLPWDPRTTLRPCSPSTFGKDSSHEPSPSRCW
jgi:hypothetical protein